MAVAPQDPPPDDPDDGSGEPGEPGDGPDEAGTGGGVAPSARRRPVVGWVVHEVGLLPLLLGPAAVTVLAAGAGSSADLVDAFVSSAVFATGVAAFVAVLRTHAFGRVSGWPLALLAASCLLGGVMLASLVHMAAFSSLPGATTATGTPLDLPAMLAAAAVVSWGPAGAAVSAVSGVMAGVWGVRFVAAVA